MAGNVVQKDFYGFVVDSAGQVIGAVNRYGVISPIGSIPDSAHLAQHSAFAASGANQVNHALEHAGLGTIAPFNRRCVIWGDSTAYLNSLQTDVPSSSLLYLGTAWAYLANDIARNPLDIVAVSGRSGMRTDQILPYFQADVAAYSPGFVIIPVGTNDIIQGIAASVALSYLVLMVKACQGIGATPVLMTIATGETTVATTSKRTQWQKYNQGVRSLAISMKLPLIDLEGLYIDPASSTSAPLSGNTDGDVHPNNLGAMKWAVETAKWMATLPARNLALYSRGTEQGISNPLMGGSGGTGNGATGTIPATCVVSKSANATMASSVVARTDGFPGNWWQANIGLPANTDYLNLILGPDFTLAGSSFSVGDVVRFTSDVQVLSQTSMQYVDLRLQFVGSSGTQWVRAYSPATSGGSGMSSFANTQLRTPEIAIPAGTTALRPYLMIAANAWSAAINLNVGAASLTKVV